MTPAAGIEVHQDSVSIIRLPSVQVEGNPCRRTKTAKALGLDVPWILQQCANELIE
jgi:hypothetical protein